MRLLRDDGPLIRIGHRGAAALAPANTLRSIELALEAGVDLVELDVLGRAGGALVLGHSRGELTPEPLTLDDALAFVAGHAPGMEIVLDVKNRGHEPALVESIRRAGAVDPALLRRLDALGVDAVITDDPRIFEAKIPA